MGWDGGGGGGDNWPMIIFAMVVSFPESYEMSLGMWLYLNLLYIYCRALNTITQWPKETNIDSLPLYSVTSLLGIFDTLLQLPWRPGANWSRGLCSHNTGRAACEGANHWHQWVPLHHQKYCLQVQSARSFCRYLHNYLRAELATW